MSSIKVKGAIILKLKKQADDLRRKEKEAKKELKKTMAKVRKIVRVYETQLVKNAKVTQAKIEEAEAAILAKLSHIMQRKADMLKRKKKVVSKVKAIQQQKIVKKKKS